MAYFGTTPDKKSRDYDIGQKAKNHAFRLSGAFWRVKEKLGLREIADHRLGILFNASKHATREANRDHMWPLQHLSVGGLTRVGRVARESLTSTQALHSFAAQKNRPLCCSPKEAKQKSTTERRLDVNPARGLHGQRPCSGLFRHSGRERERRL
jgi:hypothetical protein